MQVCLYQESIQLIDFTLKSKIEMNYIRFSKNSHFEFFVIFGRNKLSNYIFSGGGLNII